MTEFRVGLTYQENLTSDVLEAVDIVEFKDPFIADIEGMKKYEKILLLHLQNRGENLFNVVAPHFSTQVDMSGWFSGIVGAINDATIEGKLPYLSMHFGPDCFPYGIDTNTLGAISISSSELFTLDEILRNLAENKSEIFRSLGLPLILENIDYHPGSEAVEYTTKIGALRAAYGLTKEDGEHIDISHAIQSCHNMLGSKEFDHNFTMWYLRQIGLQNVREIHVSGFGRDVDGYFSDAHKLLTKGCSELAVLKSMAMEIKSNYPVNVVIEVKGSPEQLLRQVGLVKEVLQY